MRLRITLTKTNLTYERGFQTNIRLMFLRRCLPGN